MKIFMTAKFKLFKLEDGAYKLLTRDLVEGLCVGGFTFTIGDKSVSFDWDAFSCNEEGGIFEYESGYGFLFNDHELSDCYEDDWAEMGLSRSDITSEFLASASAIEEFHIDFTHDQTSEAGFGDNCEYGSEYKIELLEVCFAGENDNAYTLSADVIKRFNKGCIRS